MFALASALLLLAQRSDSLQQQIERRVAADSGARVGVAYVDLGSSDSLYINADSSFHAASTMKVPVMIELFRRANTGSFRMDQGLLMVNQFASLVDGSPFTLDPGADSDSSLYQMIGQRVPVDTLLRCATSVPVGFRCCGASRTERRSIAG